MLLAVASTATTTLEDDDCPPFPVWHENTVFCKSMRGNETECIQHRDRCVWLPFYEGKCQPTAEVPYHGCGCKAQGKKWKCINWYKCKWEKRRCIDNPEGVPYYNITQSPTLEPTTYGPTDKPTDLIITTTPTQDPTTAPTVITQEISDDELSRNTKVVISIAVLVAAILIALMLIFMKTMDII